MLNLEDAKALVDNGGTLPTGTKVIGADGKEMIFAYEKPVETVTVAKSVTKVAMVDAPTSVEVVGNRDPYARAKAFFKPNNGAWNSYSGPLFNTNTGGIFKATDAYSAAQPFNAVDQSLADGAALVTDFLAPLASYPFMSKWMNGFIKLNVPQMSFRLSQITFDETQVATQTYQGDQLQLNKNAIAFTSIGSTVHQSVDLETLGGIWRVSDQELEDVPNYLAQVTPAIQSYMKAQREIKAVSAITGSTAFTTVQRTNAGQVTAEDCRNMLAQFYDEGSQNPIWLGRKTVIAQLQKFITYVSSFNGGPLTDFLYDVPGNLLGHPIFPSFHTPALGSTGDLMLISADKLIEAVKNSGEQIKLNPYVEMAYLLQQIHITFRVKYATQYLNPIQFADGSTYSYYVGLSSATGGV
jgi:hypothetical protein